MVGERGFEPPTPWSRTRCSTRLSHSPTVLEGDERKTAPGAAIRDFVCTEIITKLRMLADFGERQPRIFPQITLTPEPILHRCLQFRQRDARSDLEHAVARGQRLIEDGIVGEVPHGEI